MVSGIIRRNKGYGVSAGYANFNLADCRGFGSFSS